MDTQEALMCIEQWIGAIWVGLGRKLCVPLAAVREITRNHPPK